VQLSELAWVTLSAVRPVLQLAPPQAPLAEVYTNTAPTLTVVTGRAAVVVVVAAAVVVVPRAPSPVADAEN